MELSYWQARWRKEKTGWHMQQVYPHLKTCWPKLQLPKSATVLVPLCGKSLDLIWLKEQGHRIIGVEISEKAIRSFAHEHKLALDTSLNSDFTIYSSENLSFWQGDFFKLKPDQLPEIDAIYDKAAMIALPPDRRKVYARHLLKFCRPHSQILMNTFEYRQEEMPGPPFSVSFEELNRHYGNHFRIELLYEDSILEDLPRFQSKGITSYLIEKVYLLTSV